MGIQKIFSMLKGSFCLKKVKCHFYPSSPSGTESDGFRRPPQGTKGDFRITASNMKLLNYT